MSNPVGSVSHSYGNNERFWTLERALASVEPDTFEVQYEVFAIEWHHRRSELGAVLFTGSLAECKAFANATMQQTQIEAA